MGKKVPMLLGDTSANHYPNGNNRIDPYHPPANLNRFVDGGSRSLYRYRRSDEVRNLSNTMPITMTYISLTKM